MNPILVDIEVEVETLDTSSDLNDFERQDDKFTKTLKILVKKENFLSLISIP